jgi:hypothetical protein
MPIVWTDAGQAHAVDCLDPATRGAQVATYYGAWGSGSTAPAVAQTALVTELAEARVACTISQQTTQSAGDTLRYLWEVTASGNRTVREFGVFTASTVGSMLVRGTLASDTPIETGDKVEFTINVQNQNGASSGS